MNEFTLFVNTIDGQSSTGCRVTYGVDPSTKKKLWDVPVASAQDVDEAVSAARAAFAGWSGTTWSHRQELLLAARQVLQDSKARMATLLTKESGKPVILSSEPRKRKKNAV